MRDRSINIIRRLRWAFLLVWLTACQQPGFVPDGVHGAGSLAIVVEAPDGADVVLRVVGPGGYEAELTGSHVLTGLVAGRYTVITEPVTLDGTPWRPEPAMAVVDVDPTVHIAASPSLAVRFVPGTTPVGPPDPSTPEPGPEPETAPVRPGSVAYHVDCVAGDDGASGVSAEAAWRSLARVSDVSLRPGDRLLLRRGCTWVGPLRVPWSGTAEWPVVVGAYGEGPRPAVRDSGANHVDVSGSHVIVEHLAAYTSPDLLWGDPDCEQQPVGWRTGFTLQAGAQHVTIRHSLAFGNTAGVHVHRDASFNRVVHNELRDNVVMSVNTNDGGFDDSGAWGIVLNGSDNEIAYNRFGGNVAWCSYDFALEGASIEVYEGSRNVIHHNVAIDDTTFSELGGSSTRMPSDNVYAYNLFATARAGAQFLIAVGALDHFGPTPGTRVYHNTVHLTNPMGTQGVVCHAGCGPDVLELRNNVLWVEWKALYADAPFAESHNLYWRADGRPLTQFFGSGMSATSRVADPRFVDAASGDLRLRDDSPAIDAGTDVAPSFATDLGGVPVPQGEHPDLGAFERSER